VQFDLLLAGHRPLLLLFVLFLVDQQRSGAVLEEQQVALFITDLSALVDGDALIDGRSDGRLFLILLGAFLHFLAGDCPHGQLGLQFLLFLLLPLHHQLVGLYLRPDGLGQIGVMLLGHKGFLDPKA
jgi:hypothetical protein